MSRRDPIVSVHHMLDHSREAIQMARVRSRGDIDTDRMLNLALVRLVEIVGEASGRVPETFRARYPQVPWQDITDMRNRLAHGYDVINFDILWEVIKDELPLLVLQLEAILTVGGHPEG